MTVLGPINAVRVFVFDLPAAQAFYEDTLGLRLQHGNGDVAVFDAGSCSLIVERADPDDEEERGFVGRFLGVSFSVHDVQAAYDDLSAKGVRFDGAPERQPWGGVLAHLLDPAGNVLTLVQSG